jgi:hypothetical protein
MGTGKIEHGKDVERSEDLAIYPGHESFALELLCIPSTNALYRCMFS